MEVNYNTSINEYLIFLRKSSNLSIKELSKKLKLNRLTIFNLERGYYKINERQKKKYINYFSLENDIFDKLNEIPESVSVEEKSLNHFFKSKIVFLVSLLISLITLITSITCYNVRQYKFQNPRNFVTSEYYNLYDKVSEASTICDNHMEVYGALTGDIFLMRTDINYYDEYYTYTKNDLSVYNNLYFAMSNSKSIIFSIYSTINDNTNDKTITVKLNYRGGINSGLKGTLSITDNTTYSSIDSNLFYSTNKGLYLAKSKGEKYQNSLDTLDTYQDLLLESLDYYFKANTNYSTLEFLNIVLPSISNFSISTVVLFYVYLISALISVASIFTLLSSIVSYISSIKTYTTNIYNNDDIKDKLSITKNKWKSPIIKEGYIKIIGVILLTISSFSLLFYYTKYLNRLDFNIYLESDVLKKITNVTRIGSIALVAVTCKTYTKDIYSLRKTSLFLVFGLWFYFLEYFFLKRAFESNVLIYMFKSYIPTNFFLAVFLLLLLSLFLFSTPKFIDSKKKLYIFRSLSLIPVILFIVSYTLKTLDMKALIDLPLEIELIIPQKTLGVELFGVLYLYSMFVYELIIKKKHSIGYLNQYKYTNKYYWVSNLIICILLLFITLIEYIPFFSQELSYVGVGKLRYTYLLVILFALYHPRIEKPNGIQNTIYALSFLISIVIPYVLIAYQVLYYIML